MDCRFVLQWYSCRSIWNLSCFLTSSGRVFHFLSPNKIILEGTFVGSGNNKILLFLKLLFVWFCSLVGILMDRTFLIDHFVHYFQLSPNTSTFKCFPVSFYVEWIVRCTFDGTTYYSSCFKLNIFVIYWTCVLLQFRKNGELYSSSGRTKVKYKVN